MGRTNPTYRDALRGIESEWEAMGRALRREYQADFERLFDRARGYADAAGYANPPDPERAFVLSVLLAHEVEIRRLHDRLDELERTAADAGGEGGIDGQDGADSEDDDVGENEGDPDGESGVTAK